MTTAKTKNKRIYNLSHYKNNKFIDVFLLRSTYDFIDLIDKITHNRKEEIVYVLCSLDHFECIVTDRYLIIQNLIQHESYFNMSGNYSLYEFENFKEAYEFANNFKNT